MFCYNLHVIPSIFPVIYPQIEPANLIYNLVESKPIEPGSERDKDKVPADKENELIVGVLVLFITIEQSRH